MPFTPPADAPRCAVVDLGSNSVRLVVYEGHSRNPMAIFNEKAVLRLGRGLQATGRLNEEGMAQAFTVMHRYQAVARAMGAEPFEVLATAAVRDSQQRGGFRRRLARADARRVDPGAVGRRGGRLLGRRRAVRHSRGGRYSGRHRRRLAGAGAAGSRRPRPQRDPRLGVIRLSERSGGDLVAGARRSPRPILPPCRGSTRRGRAGSLPRRRRLAGAGADPHRANRLPAATWCITTRWSGRRRASSRA